VPNDTEELLDLWFLLSASLMRIYAPFALGQSQPDEPGNPLQDSPETER
jgi:hypothetical protein